jgi:hypothetical protein
LKSISNSGEISSKLHFKEYLSEISDIFVQIGTEKLKGTESQEEIILFLTNFEKFSGKLYNSFDLICPILDIPSVFEGFKITSSNANLLYDLLTKRHLTEKDVAGFKKVLYPLLNQLSTELKSLLEEHSEKISSSDIPIIKSLYDFVSSNLNLINNMKCDELQSFIKKLVEHFSISIPKLIPFENVMEVINEILRQCCPY